MKDWRKKLNKDELIHLMESGVTDFASLKRNFDEQAKMRKQFPRNEPCFECKHIAVKLGMI